MWIYICDLRQIICANSSVLINQRVGRERKLPGCEEIWGDRGREEVRGKIKDERERVLGRWREGRESSFGVRSDWTDTCSLSTRSLTVNQTFFSSLSDGRKSYKLDQLDLGREKGKLKTPTFGWLTPIKKHNITWAVKTRRESGNWILHLYQYKYKILVVFIYI